MDEIRLNDEIIKNVKEEVTFLARDLMGANLQKVILYGSCARGDYTQDSDIDIALITECDRLEVKKYSDGIANISTQIAMKYFVVVNFVCLPRVEFVQRKSWYPYFKNIESEGEVLYG